jgi:hypothetical protein
MSAMKRCSSRSLQILSISLGIALSACGEFSLDTAWRSGPYRLIEIDERSEMSLWAESEDGTGMGVRVVDRTIFSIGSDKRFIVIKQHPRLGNGGDFDRTVTNYFVVTRVTSDEKMRRAGNVEPHVLGPMTKGDFESLARELSLPAFSKTFRDLE